MDDEPETTILEATYRALCERGYADLTVQRIADESDQSKAAIHYHYDSKDQLLETSLEHLYERYADRPDGVTGETARERLDALLTQLADGVDAGEFEARVDPDLAADLLTTAIEGAHTRQVAVGHSLDRAYEATRTYVDAYLTGETPSGVTV